MVFGIEEIGDEGLCFSLVLKKDRLEIDQAGLTMMVSFLDGIVKRNISLSPHSIKLLDENVHEPHAFSPLEREYIFAC